MKITIFGSGYVGLVTAACFSEVGNNVCCVDVNKDKLEKLNSGVIPIFEPGLEKLIKTNKDSNRLQFTDDLKKAVEFSDLIFIAVGTPQDEDGSADVSNIFSVADSIIENIKSDKIVVTKSTVPVGTAEQLSQYFTDELFKKDLPLKVEVVSNPEFLKEGSAINDFMKPDRIIIGSENLEAVNLLLSSMHHLIEIIIE